MSTENDATTDQIYGRVERETTDTVIFISELGRRIRFQYTGTSPQYPSAAEYQCTQCPVTALMINAQFRIVDPCAGHDCSLTAGHPRWTPPTDHARAAIKSQQSPARTPLASRFSRPVKNATKFIAKATYDANGCVTWPSERYGTTFTFRPTKSEPGRRRYFRCCACRNKCDKYKTSLKACGIKGRDLVVWGDNIIDWHPDDAGTTQGHLCQRSLLEEKLKTMALEQEKATAQDAPKVAKIANGRNEDTNSEPKITADEEPSSKLGNARGRSLAKRPRALSAESFEDKTFGKACALPSSALTKAEHLVWSSAPSINTGPMRDKELIAYRSQTHKRRFKFVLAGPSSLDEHAFDYFCLDCWISHEEDCRVTVRSSTQEFIITDPERTSSGRHACVEASSARPSVGKKPLSTPRRSPAVAKEPLPGLVNVEEERLRSESDVFPVAVTSARSMEYFSEQYQAKLKFTFTWQGKKGQAYYVCMKCRTLQGKMRNRGYECFGYTKIELNVAFVVAGRFVRRHPDECGVKLFVGDTVERRHICHDHKLKKLLDAEGAICKERGEPTPKRLRDATQGAPNGYNVGTSIHTQSGNSSRAETRQHDGSDGILADQRAGAHAELSHPRDSLVDEAIKELNSESTAPTPSDGSSRQRDADIGPAVNALHFPKSSYSVSSAAQRATGSGSETPDSDRTLIDQLAGTQAELSRPKDSEVDQATSAQATATRNNENSHQSDDLDLGPAVDALDESLQRAESTYTVSSAAHNITGSRADTPHQSDANGSTTQPLVEEEQKPHLFDERREDATATNDSNNPTPTTQKAIGTSRVTCSAATSGTRKRFWDTSIDVKPPTKKPQEVLTIDDSDDDTDVKGASMNSKKKAKREPDEHNDPGRLQGGSVAKFHRFIEEFGFVAEYAAFSLTDTGKTMEFLQRSHVMEKWIIFNNRR